MSYQGQWNTVFLGLGSNLGYKSGNLCKVIRWFEALPQVTQLMMSSFYQSDPVGFEDQPKFLNAVICFKTCLTPEQLMDRCLGFEKELGRDRNNETQRNGPRLIDIDILFFGDEVMNRPNLVLPHPRMHEREFVLKPFSELDPGWVHPVLNVSIIELLSRLQSSQAVQPINLKEVLAV